VTVVMCVLVVEMGEIEREVSGGRQYHSHMSGVLPPESHLFMCMCLTYCAVTLRCAIDVMG
jgi:hypothetical protein